MLWNTVEYNTALLTAAHYSILRGIIYRIIHCKSKSVATDQETRFCTDSLYVTLEKLMCDFLYKFK